MDYKCKMQHCNMLKRRTMCLLLPGGDNPVNTRIRGNTGRGQGQAVQRRGSRALGGGARRGTPGTREERPQPRVRPLQSRGPGDAKRRPRCGDTGSPEPPVGGHIAATTWESKVAIPTGAGAACAPRGPPPGASLRAPPLTLAKLVRGVASLTASRQPRRGP